MKSKRECTKTLKSCILDFSLLILIFIFVSSCAKIPADQYSKDSNVVNVISSDQQNTLQEVIDDMNKSHEAIPHGVPTGYDWYSSPVIKHIFPPAGFSCITSWGQFYETVGGNKASNTRVQIRNLRTYYLSNSSSKWDELQINDPIDGKLIIELQDTIDGKPADIRQENEGISSTAGSGFCFHYWPRLRSVINPSDIKAVFTCCDARLIIANTSLPDDRSLARYILNMGADYWQYIYTGSNTPVGMGRFKYVKTGWRTFNFTTLSEATLRQNPPPLNQ